MAARLSYDFGKKSVDARTFRSAVALLKRKGLVKSSIDARGALPGQKSGSKRLVDLVAEFDDVVSGKSEPVKLTPTKTREYKAAGYEVKKVGREKLTMVPKSSVEKVKVTKEGDIQITHPSGIVRIKKAVPYTGLVEWLRKMREDHLRIDAMKSAKEYFAYKFYGNNSYAAYRSIEDLMDDLINGSASGLNLMDKALESTRKQQAELYQNLEIVRIPTLQNRPEPVLTPGKSSKAARQRYLVRIRGTRAYENIKEANRKASAAYRARLKGKAKKEYKEAAKKRAKKSRKNG